MDTSDLSDEELERTAIIEPRSSDDEYSTDSDVTTPVNKSKPQPYTGSVSVCKTVVNIINFIEGIGFLALPYAVKRGGIAAIVAFLITPIFSCYTGTVLIDCLYDTDEKQRRVRVRSTFKDLGEVLWPKYGGYLVTVLVHVTLYVVSVSYLILCGSLMSHAVPSVPLTVTEWTCIAGVVVLPTTFLKSLSEIAWISALSVVALISVLIAVLWYGIEHVDEWNLGTILFWDTEGVTIALPIIILSYGATGILPLAEDSMREKHKFPMALALAYLVLVLVKLSFAFVSFLSFGSSTLQVIINNFPAGPFRMSISFLFVFSCLLSYALPLRPVFLLLEETEVITNTFSKIPILGSILIRIIMVLSTVVIAILVPKFALIISFTGSIIGSFLNYIFPCALHLKLRFHQLKAHEVCIDVLLILFGAFVLIFGAVFSGKALFIG